MLAKNHDSQIRNLLLLVGNGHPVSMPSCSISERKGACKVRTSATLLQGCEAARQTTTIAPDSSIVELMYYPKFAVKSTHGKGAS